MTFRERFRAAESRAVRALAGARERLGPVWAGLRRRTGPFRARAWAWLGPRLARLRGLWPPAWKPLLIALGVAAVVWLIVWERCGLTGCPDVDTLAAYQPGGAPVVLDREGNEVARLAPFSRALVSLEDLPEPVKDAFLAVEDQRFYDHGGVDWRRAAGSVLANVKAGGISEGFSTITMQLARNVFPERLPGSERTPRRKLLEVRVAREIEDRFTKDEILELYLNHIYFGGALYGIDAAARSYFGKPASDLTLAEAATLAAMPKAPNSYDPRENPERARERRDLVLSLMAAQGRITAEEEARARDQRVRTRAERPLSPPGSWPTTSPPTAPSTGSTTTTGKTRRPRRTWRSTTRGGWRNRARIPRPCSGTLPEHAKFVPGLAYAFATLFARNWGQDNAATRQLFTSALFPDSTKDEFDAFNELQHKTTSPRSTPTPTTCPSSSRPATAPSRSDPPRPLGRDRTALELRRARAQGFVPRRWRLRADPDARNLPEQLVHGFA